MIKFHDEPEYPTDTNANEPEKKECACIPQVTSCFFCCPNQMPLRQGFLAFTFVNAFAILWVLAFQFVPRPVSGVDDGRPADLPIHHLHETDKLFKVIDLISGAAFLLGAYAGVTRKIGLVKAFLIIRFVFAMLHLLNLIITLLDSYDSLTIAFHLVYMTLWFLGVGWEYVIGISFYRVLVKGGTGDEVPRISRKPSIGHHGNNKQEKPIRAPVIGQASNVPPGEYVKTFVTYTCTDLKGDVNLSPKERNINDISIKVQDNQKR